MKIAFVKITSLTSLAYLSALALSGLLGETSLAADATWNINTAGNWADDSSWNPLLAPGSTSGTTSTDIATFGTVITGSRAITVDADRNIFGINFAGNSSTYHLTGGSLVLTNGGTIQTSGSGSAHTDLISTSLLLAGDGGSHYFAAGSTTSTRLLSIAGNVSGASTGANVTTLNLNGSNTGGNSVSGIISDGAGGGKLAVVKSGAGTWTLSGSNSYTGGTTISDGQLTATNLAAFGNSSGVGSRKISLGDTSGGNNATLRSTVDMTNANEITILSGGSGTNTLVMANSAAGDHFNTSSIILGSGTVGKGVVLTSANEINGWTGVISDGASVAAGTEGVVTIQGTTGRGTYFGNGSSSYKGGTVINGATLANSVAIAVSGSVFGTGSVTLNGGSFGQFANATVTGYSQLILNNDLNVTNQFDRTLALNGAAGSTVNLGATGTASSRVISSVVGASLTLGGVIQDGSNGFTKGITKNGSGDVLLSAASTYTGATTINNGRIVLTQGNDRLATTTDLVLNGGALELNTRSQTVATLSGSSSATISNSNNTAGTSVLTVSGTGSSTFDGKLVATTNAGRLGLAKDSTGTLTLNGSQSFSGGTTVTAGTLIVNGGLTSASAQSQSTTISNNRNTLTVADTSGMVVGQTVSGGGIAAGTYITAITSGSTVILSQAATSGGSASRSFGAYAGSGLGSGFVSVGVNGTLGGTGVIAPTGTNGMVVNGVLAPGNSIGTLTVDLANTTGAVAMGGTGSFKFELGTANVSIGSIAAGSSDLLVLSGASANDFAFNGNTVDFLGTGESGYYLLFDTSFDETTWSGLTFDSITGVVSGGLAAANLAANLSGNFIVGTASNGGSLGDIYFQATAVPEPAGALLFGAGACVLLFRRRRQV